MSDDSILSAAKGWLQSKTFWANLLGPVFLWLATKYGVKLDPDTQAAVILVIMALSNLVLRKLTTQPVAGLVAPTAPPSPPATK